MSDLATVEWDTGAVAYDGDTWRATKDTDGSGAAGAALANARQLLQPDGPSAGKPGAAVAYDVAEWAGDGAKVTLPPDGDPNTVY